MSKMNVTFSITLCLKKKKLELPYWRSTDAKPVLTEMYTIHFKRFSIPFCVKFLKI